METRHTLRDPGDGSMHFALSTTLLTYGGEGVWADAKGAVFSARVGQQDVVRFVRK